MKTTDLVIEGYPRSANTFSLYAFRMAQKQELEVANHFHRSVQFVLAAKWNIPALLVLRHPWDSILSNMLFFDSEDSIPFANDYCSFHNCLLPILSNILVAEFDEIITDFGKVTGRINDKFGTFFEEFDHTLDNVDLARNQIRLASLEREKLIDGFHMPTSVTPERKAECKDILERQKGIQPMKDAVAIFEKIRLNSGL